MNSLYSAVTDTLSNLFFGRANQEPEGGGLNNSFTLGTTLNNPLREDLRRDAENHHNPILYPGNDNSMISNSTIGGGSGKHQRNKFSIYSPPGAFQARMGGVGPNVFGGGRPRSSGMMMSGISRGAGGTGESQGSNSKDQRSSSVGSCNSLIEDNGKGFGSKQPRATLWKQDHSIALRKQSSDACFKSGLEGTTLPLNINQLEQRLGGKPYLILNFT